jgi:hypothetical protein
MFSLSAVVLAAAGPAADRALGAGAEGAGAGADPRLAALIEGIVAERLLDQVDALVAFGTRRWDQPGARQAQELITSFFSDLGLDEVYAHDFDEASDNVIGILRGTVRPERIHVIGAHYDSIVAGQSPGGPAPGADDNASGTAALLEVARAIAGAGERPAETILFAAFTKEEPGIVGSRAFVADLVADQAEIADMINLDVIGYLAPGTRLDISVTSDTFTPAIQTLVERIAQVAALYLPERPFEVGNPPPCTKCSDHSAFVERGYPAVAFFEDMQYFCPYMHTTNDVVGIGLNSPELVETDARVAAAAIAVFAGLFGLAESPSFRRGDVIPDRSLNLTDVISLLEYMLLGGDAPGCLEAADANDDGELDISDPIRILLALFGGQAPLPPPSCGPDPTEDTLGCGAPAACGP